MVGLGVERRTVAAEEQIQDIVLVDREEVFVPRVAERVEADTDLEEALRTHPAAAALPTAVHTAEQVVPNLVAAVAGHIRAVAEADMDLGEGNLAVGRPTAGLAAASYIEAVGPILAGLLEAAADPTRNPVPDTGSAFVCVLKLGWTRVQLTTGKWEMDEGRSCPRWNLWQKEIAESDGDRCRGCNLGLAWWTRRGSL